MQPHELAEDALERAVGRHHLADAEPLVHRLRHRPLQHRRRLPGGHHHQAVFDPHAFHALDAAGDLCKPPRRPAADLHLRGQCVHEAADLGRGAAGDEPSAEDHGQPRVEVVVSLSPALADLSIGAVVGPGVVRSGHVAGLVEVARRGGIGVFNTFGAKGVFRWDNPLHFGTIGLQERDLDLAALAEFDIVITSGLDPQELPPGALADLVVQDVAPWQLPALLADWPRARRDPGERPPLYSTVSSIVTPMYERDGAPLAPPRAALQLAGAGPDNAVVAADAGLAGFWIARTFPTGTPGSAVVPAHRQPGFAAAAALVARLDGRPCIGVTDGPLDEASELVLEAARSMSVPVALQIWGEGDTDAERHLAATQAGFALGGPGSEATERIDHIGVDGTCMQPLVDALGSISAWEI